MAYYNIWKLLGQFGNGILYNRLEQMVENSTPILPSLYLNGRGT